MPQVYRAQNKRTTLGGSLSGFGSAMSAMPGIGGIAGGAAKAMGGAMEKEREQQTSMPEVQDPAMAAKQRRLEGSEPPPAQDLSPDQMKQLQDSMKAAQEMPAAIQQQTAPVLAAAYEEALRRRMGGYA